MARRLANLIYHQGTEDWVLTGGRSKSAPLRPRETWRDSADSTGSRQAFPPYTAVNNPVRWGQRAPPANADGGGRSKSAPLRPRETWGDVKLSRLAELGTAIPPYTAIEGPAR